MRLWSLLGCLFDNVHRGWGFGSKSEVKLHSLIAVAPFEQAVGDGGGGVLVVRGELMVVGKVAI